jgi:hypothetical protein
MAQQAKQRNPESVNDSSSSLWDTWHPVTHDFGIIKAPVEIVVNALIEWHASINMHYQRHEIADGLSHALNTLLPLSQAKQRRLFLATRTSWRRCRTWLAN